MKTVDFNGQQFDVPDWARYITLDDYGTVVAWEHPPKRVGKHYSEVFACRQCPVGFIRNRDTYQEVR